MIGNKTNEHFAVMLLSAQMKMIDCKVLFTGTIAEASVYVREIVKYALLNDAHSVLISHNHPSGTCQPSTADLRITERIIKSLALLDIPLNDHIIVSGDQFRPLRENSNVWF